MPLIYLSDIDNHRRNMNDKSLKDFKEISWISLAFDWPIPERLKNILQ
jgi:hypothetical protein